MKLVPPLPLDSNVRTTPALKELQAAMSEFGTPLYLYDRELLIRQITAFRSLFDGLATIFFAAFCNTNPSLLGCMRQRGLGCLVSSPLELAIAKHVGFSNAQIIVTGSSFQFDELEAFARSGLAINIDSAGQLQALANVFQRIGSKSRRAGVRLNISDCFSPGAPIPINSCVGGESRVGIFEGELPAFLTLAREVDVTIDTLHVYTGTNQLDAGLMLSVAKRLFGIAMHNPEITTINLGGGFGLPYKNRSGLFPWDEFVSNLRKMKEQFETANGRSIALQIEPGRSLIGPVGWLACRVVDVKSRANGRYFVSTDTNLSNFPRPYIYGANGQHAVTHLPTSIRAPAQLTATVCGNAIASGDRIAEEVQFNSLPHPGDVIVVHDAGAYGYSMSSRFCGRLRPAEVLLTESGPICIRERERIETELEKLIPIQLDSRAVNE